MDIVLAELAPEDYPFVLGASILAALFSLYLFVRNWKRLRIIEDTPTARLRSAHQGYIELEGKGRLIVGGLFTRRYPIIPVCGIAVRSNSRKLLPKMAARKRAGMSCTKTLVITASCSRMA